MKTTRKHESSDDSFKVNESKKPEQLLKNIDEKLRKVVKSNPLNKLTQELDAKRVGTNPLLLPSMMPQPKLTFDRRELIELKTSKAHKINDDFFSQYRDVIFEYNISVEGIYELVKLESMIESTIKEVFDQKRFLFLDGKVLKHYGENEDFKEKSPVELFKFIENVLPPEVDVENLTIERMSEEEEAAVDSAIQAHLILLSTLSSKEEPSKATGAKRTAEKMSNQPHIDTRTTKKAHAEDTSILSHERAHLKESLDPVKFNKRQAERQKKIIKQANEIRLDEIEKERVKKDIQKATE